MLNNETSIEDLCKMKKRTFDNALLAKDDKDNSEKENISKSEYNIEDILRAIDAKYNYSSSRRKTKDNPLDFEIDKVKTALNILTEKLLRIDIVLCQCNKLIERYNSKTKEQVDEDIINAFGLECLKSKKNTYEEYGKMVETEKINAGTLYAKLVLFKNKDNPSFIDGNISFDELKKLYTPCDNYTNMINDANTLEELENIMKIASDILGVGQKGKDSMVDNALGIKNEPKVKKEETKETVKEETNNDKTLEDIRKSIK